MNNFEDADVDRIPVTGIKLANNIIIINSHFISCFTLEPCFIIA